MTSFVITFVALLAHGVGGRWVSEHIESLLSFYLVGPEIELESSGRVAPQAEWQVAFLAAPHSDF